MDSEVRSLNGKLSTLKAKFGNLTLKEASLDGKKLEKIIAQKAQVHQDLQILEKKRVIIDLTDNDILQKAAGGEV
ncbi:MAG TPA: hypothetical protein ENN90_03830 [Mariniphaga anaerophila]|uniref:Uncharacterized protein n=1 Tax=Mariniphaga anaerophila TaxID=1484053 RepID=A0A831PPM2_9BACT|nr:hypothetical protein [Mariniphaga anaerophila]